MNSILDKLRNPFLIILSIVLFFIAAGSVIFYFGLTEIRPPVLSSLTLAFAIISAITILIFLRGRQKEEKEGAMHTLVAISLKFFLEMILALLWFAAAKKTGLDYILLFFVLYLSFSLCSIIIILNILKKKSL